MGDGDPDGVRESTVALARTVMAMASTAAVAIGPREPLGERDVADDGFATGSMKRHEVS